MPVQSCPALTAWGRFPSLQAPQVWLAAALALAGVGTLELGGGDGLGAVGAGDAFSVLRNVSGI